MTTKEGFKERIVRNMAIDDEPKTKDEITKLFSPEVCAEAKKSLVYVVALSELVKEGTLRKRGEKYIICNDGEDCGD